MPVKLAEYVAMQLYAILNIKGAEEEWQMGYKPQTEKHLSTLVS